MMDTIVMIRSVMVSDCIILYSLLFEYSENIMAMFRNVIWGWFAVNFARLRPSYFSLIYNIVKFFGNWYLVKLEKIVIEMKMTVKSHRTNLFKIWKGLLRCDFTVIFILLQIIIFKPLLLHPYSDVGLLHFSPFMPLQCNIIPTLIIPLLSVLLVSSLRTFSPKSLFPCHSSPIVLVKYLSL